MPFISEKYYFMNTNLDTNYATLWNGFFKFDKFDCNPIPYLDIDNILLDICDVNFYINLDLEKNLLYISLCQDEKYYIYQFEKHIKKVIKKFEECLNIIITSAEFNATELKHEGYQYKYNVTRDINNRIILKKRILNWENIDKKKQKKQERDEDDINEKLNDLTLR